MADRSNEAIECRIIESAPPIPTHQNMMANVQLQTEKKCLLEMQRQLLTREYAFCVEQYQLRLNILQAEFIRKATAIQTQMDILNTILTQH